MANPNILSNPTTRLALLVEGQLSAGFNDYVVPANTSWTVKSVTLHNTSAAPVRVEGWLIAPAGTPRQWLNVDIAPDATFIAPAEMLGMLPEAATLRLSPATAAVIDVLITGVVASGTGGATGGGVSTEDLEAAIAALPVRSDNTDVTTPAVGEVLAVTGVGPLAYGLVPQSGIPATTVDAKGELIVATAADTVTRLPAGANGHVLTADLTETPGVKWAPPTALNVKDYGAVGDGIADDTAAVQATLTAVPAAGAAVFFPAGTYLVPNGGLSCASPVHLLGVPGLDGTGSRIRVTADAVTGLTLSGSASVMEHIEVSHPTGGTRSATLIGVVVNNANFSKVVSCRVAGFSTNLKVATGSYYSVLNSSFRDFVLVGLDYTNGLGGGDAGDGTIQNCTFDRGSDTVIGGTAVLWHSGGGMRFINNKINGRPSGAAYFEHGLRLVMDANVGTGVLIVGNNSIENFTGTGISFPNVEGSGFFNTMVITGNEVSGLDGTAASTGILLDTGVSGVVITGNHIYTVATGIDLQRVKHAAVSGNSLSNISATGIRVRGFCKDVIVDRQPIDVLVGGADIIIDDAYRMVDPYYEKAMPFGGNNGSGMPPILDNTQRDLFEIAVSAYGNVVVDVDVTGTAQGNGSWVTRQTRMVAGNAPSADLSVATIGTDYVFQGSSAVVVLTTSGLAGVFRLGVQKVSGTSLSGHMRVKVRGSGMTSFKQLQRYN